MEQVTLSRCVWCHTLWIGETLPAWVIQCIASYLRTGHEVHWWIYAEERESDMLGLELLCAEWPLLVLRDAGEICPFASARSFYYYGGPRRFFAAPAQGTQLPCHPSKWAGWAPFSDFFRYETLYRYGGWWIDADSVAVRRLPQGDDAVVVATELWKRDRRRIGVVSLDPLARVDTSAQCCPAPPFFEWAAQASGQGRVLGLVTNSHMRAPRGSLLLLHLAEAMRAALEKYAQGAALTSGLLGMQLLQREIRSRLQARATSLDGEAIHVMHWTVCNPVAAGDAPAMRDMLSSSPSKMLPAFTSVIHIFRVTRDRWRERGEDVPVIRVDVEERSG